MGESTAFELLLHGGHPILMDRAALLARLDAIRHARRAVGLLYVDIDQFHQVNTRWGQEVGDAVLEALSARLLSLLPLGGALTRTSGDAFIVVLADADLAVSRTNGERILDAVRAPIIVETCEGSIPVSIAASAGVACQSESDRRGDVLEQAFLACRRAKAKGPGTLVAYELALDAQAVSRQRLAEDLRHAASSGELRLFYQPTIDLHDGRIVGVEALVRWQHPIDGLLSPATFLPVAEAADLMVSIGDWVLEEAIHTANRWRTSRAGEPMRVWVNLAAQQLADGARLRDRVSRALRDGEITARSIGFEVTESSLLEDLPVAVELLSSFRELGIEIALDDFGTGYSSLTYLRRLPVTAVKIDRSFVTGVGGSLADEAIVSAVIDLAHALGLRVIAEGIEEVPQAEILIRMGADQAQGFHFGRPEPADVVEHKFTSPWCGATAPDVAVAIDHRADELPGFGSPRARLLLAALDTAHDSIVVTAATGGDGEPPIVYVNAAFEAETGFRAMDLVGRPARDLLPEVVMGDESIREWFDEVRAEKRATTTEVPMRRADGSVFPCELTLSPISDERGVHTHWLYVRRDLTQRRKTEGDRSRFQSLIDQSSSLVFLGESGGQWVYANAAMRRALGLSPDESLEGLNTADVVGPYTKVVEKVVMPTLDRHKKFSGQGSFVNRVTGEITEVEIDVQVFDDPLRPGIRIFAAVSRDITELKKIEAAERRRRELGTFAAGLAQRALASGREELFADMDNVLASVGALLRADLTYLDTIDVAAGLLRPVGSWTSPRYEGREEPAAEIPVDRLQQWFDVLSDTELLVGELAGHQSPWVDESSALFPAQPHGVKAFAPLRVGGELLGVLGVVSLDEEHRWSADEIETVQQIADTLANLLSRQRAEDAIRASEEKLSAMLSNVADILVVIDREGWIRFINPRVEAVTGYSPDEILGQTFLFLVHPDDQEMAIERFADTVAGIETPPTEIRLLHRDGTCLWFDVESSGLYDPIVGGYLISLRNMTIQRIEADEAERRAEFERVILGFSRWALEVESGDAISGLNEHLGELGRMLNTDSAFASFLEDDVIRNVAGWRAEGVPSAAVDLPSEFLPAIAARYRTLEAFVVDDIEQHHEDWADEWRTFPVVDRSGLNVPLVSHGRCLGNIGVAMTNEPRVWQPDEIALVQRVAETVAVVLARHQVEDALRISEARLAALLNGSLDLVVVVGSDHTIMYANGAVERSLGYTPAALVGCSVAKVVHPDDVAVASARLDTLLEGLPTQVTTVRLVAADGSVGSWEITSGVVRDPIAGGRVLTCRDVTERVAREAQATTRVEYLRYAFDVAQAALDLDATEFLSRLPSVCERITAMLGVDLIYVDQLDERRALLTNLAGRAGNGAVLRVQPGESLSFDVIPAWVERLRHNEPIVVTDARASEDPWVVEKRDVLGHEGGLIAVGMSAAGELFGVIGVSMTVDARTWTDDEVTFIRIIAETIAHVLERARLEAELEWQALHDPLTGLGNRLLLKSRLGQPVDRTGSSHDVAVLMFDLDGFKEINDTYGHAVGDDVLRIIAARLMHLTREGDTLARTGGDEFVLLCPNTSVDDAVKIGERIVRAVGMPISTGSITVEIDASVGVARRRGDADDHDWMLIEADHAMYAAKRAGRGLVRVAGMAA